MIHLVGSPASNKNQVRTKTASFSIKHPIKMNLFRLTFTIEGSYMQNSKQNPHIRMIYTVLAGFKISELGYMLL